MIDLAMMCSHTLKQVDVHILKQMDVSDTDLLSAALCLSPFLKSNLPLIGIPPFSRDMVNMAVMWGWWEIFSDPLAFFMSSPFNSPRTPLTHSQLMPRFYNYRVGAGTFGWNFPLFFTEYGDILIVSVVCLALGTRHKNTFDVLECHTSCIS